ncbi:amino acid adenylation domain-containing protein/thioester reductase-like protein [Janthinobacterium sp. CG_23.3]|uniref:amino acid adenylation domain-containing protein n=1 Tax=Janthinobacterium sp. CG_23.3 TaxID=3349634 RepID=UPI0038D4583F
MDKKILPAGSAADMQARRSNLSDEKRKLLALRLKGAAAGPAKAAGIARRGASGPQQLSFAQQRLWFLDQLMPGNPYYNVPSAHFIEGALRVAVLEKSINEIVRRHEALRTTIVTEGNEPLQLVQPFAPTTLALIDCQGLGAAERDAHIAELVQAEAAAPFDLSQSVLRVKVVRLGPELHLLLLTMHHIVTDGWSNGVFMRELMELYLAFSMGLPSPLAELPIQYGDFSQWQRERLQGGLEHTQVGYWKQQLRDAPLLLQLPIDRLRPATQSFRGAVQNIRLDAELTRALRSLSEQSGGTLFMTLLAGFSALLFRYSGQRDMVIGTPTANRNHTSIEPLIGFFVNTLALRMQVSGELSFSQLLAQVRDVTLQAYDHQDVPFEKLIDELGLERDMSRNPLIQATFALQNAPAVSAQVPNLSIRPYDTPVEAVRFDMEVHLFEDAGELSGCFVYCTDLFDAATMARMVGHYENLLRAAVAQLDRPLSTLALLKPEERKQLLSDWNQTDADYPREHCAYQLFEQQVLRTPAAVAAECAGATLSYAELNERANRVARTLRARGVGLESLVGVCFERSLDLVVALLAVWKAGAAYVPLDPAHPTERLAFMVKDSQSSLVLTQASLRAALAGCGVPLWCLDTERDGLADAAGANLEPLARPDNLAYVIYTSGSTGLPKGVAIEHRGLVNYLSWCGKAYHVEAGYGAPVHSSIGFDATITSLYAPLLAGQRVILVPDGDEIAGLIEVLNADHRFSLIKITPAHLDLLNHAHGLHSKQPQTFVIGGEALLGSTLATWRLRAPASRFVNEYGPTETVVGCCVYDVPAGAGLNGPVPIGRPIANTRLYILDGHGEPVPVGIAGELHIGGDGVARGYLHRPELTKEKFIPDLLSGRPGQRLYKTGDLARYLPDGTIEFLGRLDHQVKIRGYRIELGEIEAALLSHPDVLEAVALAREERAGDKRLVAYVVARDVAQQSGGQARRAVGGAARDEMVLQWQQVFQDSYGKSAARDQAVPDFAGWNSSYTGLPIADAEMREWVDNTVARIAGLRPVRLMEIGCGTGLLLNKLAPSCDYYLGTDFSREALHHTQRMLEASPVRAHIELLHQPAHDFRKLEGKSFDTVVLNSVIQYFPNLDYLLDVLKNAVDAVAAGGQIFIGDVRSLPLLEAFHASVQAFKASQPLSREEVGARVRQRAAMEEELLIHPHFFYSLQQKFPQISHVQVLVTRARYHNELSKFRYDVVLHVARPVQRVAAIDWLDWRAAPLTSDYIKRQLLLDRQPTVAIRNIANARLQHEVRLLGWLHGADAGQPMPAPAASGDAAIDPELLWALGSELDYHTEIRYAATAEGEFDAIFTRRSGEEALLCFDDAVATATPPAGGWSNNPLQNAFKRQLAVALRQHIKTKLPAFMLPSAYVVLDALPLTQNGKVDRDLLPPSAGLGGEPDGAHIAPRTETERVLAALWSELLGVERVGAEDNFFDLGGHSLLTTQVIARVRDLFKLNLPLSILFQQPTVAALAQVIDAAVRDGITDVPAPNARVNLAAEVVLDAAIQPLSALPQIANQAVAKAIFLTGGSGFLGAYLLHDLLRGSDARLYCLIRADGEEEGLQRIKDNLATYGLWYASLAARICPVPGDLAAPLLGLTPERFAALAQQIDVIYHNGAWVNFTFPYQSLKASNVAGTQEVIRLASQTRRKPLHFISTVSVFPATKDAALTMLESDPLNNWEGLSSGYSQSKWVAEKLVSLAGERGLPVSIYRPGTITGDSKTGTCNTSDLIFRMLKGCVQLGLAPQTDAMVGMVAVDYVSAAIVHLSRQQASLSRAFHIVNPRYAPLNELVGIVVALGYTIDMTTYAQWRAELLRRTRQPADNALHPFLPMFTEQSSDEREPQFDCRYTLDGLAGTGIACPEVDEQLMRTYFHYFNQSGFLSREGAAEPR